MEKKYNRNNKKKKNVPLIVLICLAALLLICLGILAWYFTNLIHEIHKPIPSPSDTVNPSDLLTATPKHDAMAKYQDGTEFDGYIFQWEERSDENKETQSEEFKYIKSNADADFIVEHISAMINDELFENYSFGQIVKLYIPIPEGYDGNGCYLYKLEDGKLTLLTKTCDGMYIITETETTGVYVITPVEINIEAPPVETPTPTPPVETPTPTPSVETPTPTPPVETPTPTPPVETPTPTLEPTPTPTPAVPTPTPTPEELPTIPPIVDVEDVVNIALFGLDARANVFTGRSDTIMILSINTKTNEMTLTSIMRDLYVPLYNQNNQMTGYNKINAAYSLYGIDGAINTIRNYFGFEIDYYAVINFTGIEAVVDILGGVDLGLSAAEAKVVLGDGYGAGTYHLTPSQALRYARERYIDNDRGRTLRQGKLLQSLMDKFSSASFNELLQLLNKCVEYIRTDMNLSTMYTLAQVMYNGRAGGLHHDSYPYAPGFVGGYWDTKYYPNAGNVVYEINRQWQLDWFHKRIFGYSS